MFVFLIYTFFKKKKKKKKKEQLNEIEDSPGIICVNKRLNSIF